MLREVNELGRSREHAEAAVQAKPQYVSARLQLGVTLLAQGDADAAQAQWNRALEIEPENARAKMYLRTLQLQRESGLFKAQPVA